MNKKIFVSLIVCVVVVLGFIVVSPVLAEDTCDETPGYDCMADKSSDPAFECKPATLDLCEAVLQRCCKLKAVAPGVGLGQKCGTSDGGVCCSSSLGCEISSLSGTPTCASGGTCCKLENGKDCKESSSGGTDGSTGGGEETIGGTTVSLAEINPLGADIVGLEGVQKIIGRIILGILGVIGSVALLMFVYGGFVLLASSGKTDLITKGKNILTWAAIGIVVVLGSYTLVNFIFQGITAEPGASISGETDTGATDLGVGASCNGGLGTCQLVCSDDEQGQTDIDCDTGVCCTP